MILSPEEKKILAFALEDLLALDGLSDLLREQFELSYDDDFCDPFLVLHSDACLNVLPNNGRGHSLNPAQILFDNFRFRHESEAYMYQAFKSRSILLSPLSVWAQQTVVGKTIRREPDLQFFHRGQLSFLEIDGASHHSKTVNEETERIQHFLNEGANFIRIIYDGNWNMHLSNLYRNICLSISEFIRIHSLTGHEIYLDFILEDILNQYHPLPFVIEYEEEQRIELLRHRY